MANRYQFISGHYTATWNGVNIGTTRRGFRIRQTVHKQDIAVDESGEAAVDAINMGVEYAIELDWVEYEKVKAALLASSGSQSSIGQGLTNVGTLQTSLAKALVLTPVVTPSSTQQTHTASYAIVEGDIEYYLSSGLKEGACSFHCYPDPTASTNASATAITVAP